jgi:26S proteasome regulatory subunit N8
MHVPSVIEAEEAEEIGVEHLLRDIKDNAIGTLSTRLSDQLGSMRGLVSRLGDIQSYLHKVVSGELPVHHEIIYNLQDVFNCLPQVDSPQVAKSFNVKTNDQLMVMYLASIIRSVIALHNLIDNKLENKEAEEAALAAESKEDSKLKEQKEAKSSTGEVDVTSPKS